MDLSNDIILLNINNLNNSINDLQEIYKNNLNYRDALKHLTSIFSDNKIFVLNISFGVSELLKKNKNKNSSLVDALINFSVLCNTFIAKYEDILFCITKYLSYISKNINSKEISNLYEHILKNKTNEFIFEMTFLIRDIYSFYTNEYLQKKDERAMYNTYS